MLRTSLSSTDVRSLVATLSVIGNVKNSECNIEASYNIKKNVQIVLFLTKESNIARKILY